MNTPSFSSLFSSLLPKHGARLLLHCGMILLFVQLSIYVLGGGFSPVLVGFVLGYGLTDKLTELAGR